MPLGANRCQEAFLSGGYVDPVFPSLTFVAENVNGLGGDLGRLAGGAVEHGFKPWQPVVLGEFQKSIAGSIQVAGAGPEVRAGLSTLLLQAAVARTAFLRAQTATTATQYPANPAGLVPDPAVPVPFFFGTLMLEFPLMIRVDHGDAPVATTPQHFSHEEHSGLAEHSIHYEHASHSGHASPSSSHPEPTHKR